MTDSANDLVAAVANGPNGNGCLDFEKPLAELESQIAELQTLQHAKGIDYSPEIRQLRGNLVNLTAKIYSHLSPWETVQVARHPRRPLLTDYISMMVKDFRPLHGDRRFSDDPAIVTGFGRLGREKVMIVGHNKGRTTKEKVACNFGCAHPEGYRKAIAKMKLAEKFKLPIVCLIDTPGAFPGIGAEERGQAQAIAETSCSCPSYASRLSAPSSVKAAPAAPSVLASATTPPCSNTPGTPSLPPKPAPPSSGATAPKPPQPLPP